MANRSETEMSPVLNLLHDVLAALNPLNLWNALQEADEGICLMEPVRVRVHDRRRR